jgi:imidazole glycerol-phosphate synthase subunit HisH
VYLLGRCIIKKTTIIDLGLSNIRSAKRAFEHCGSDIVVTSDVSEISKADRLVLPGVGSFKAAMDELSRRHLIEPIVDFAVNKQRPLLGICLGMQLLLECSEEFGLSHGLKIIAGNVVALPNSYLGKPIKVPNIGWRMLIPVNSDKTFQNTIFQSIGDYYVYFVHSFAAKPETQKDVLAIIKSNELEIVAAIQKSYVIGCQFHPEKSGRTGINILKNFLKI